MKDLYRMTYFDHRKYILEEFDHLDLSSDEVLLVFMIDYFNEFDLHIDLEVLSKKTKLSLEVVDATINSLITKGYLEIQITQKQVYYALDGVFQVSNTLQPIDPEDYRSLFELYEKAFGRPLSQNEYMKLKDWMSEFEEKLIEYALMEAVIYDKKSFNYIYAILNAWKEKGLSAAAYEQGER